MKVPAVMTVALIAVCVSGCMYTHHWERSYYSGPATDADGNSCACEHSRQDERHWFGPWIVQPDRARP